LLAIQEPFLDHLKSSRPPVGWRPVYPSTHFKKDSPRSCSFITVNPKISTNEWEQVECPSPDVTAIRIKIPLGSVLVINVYN
ncbi:hypothetical protein BDV93DRAFT_424597, partial [Ceratobasidium sp. AG-I]